MALAHTVLAPPSLATPAAASLARSVALDPAAGTRPATDPKTKASSSYRFYSGWAASSAGDRPDRIPVAANKPSYKPGEVAHISIKPVADGRALVVVAGDRVYSSQMVDAPGGKTRTAAHHAMDGIALFQQELG